MSDYNEYKKKVLTDSVIKREYDALASEYEAVQKLIDSDPEQNEEEDEDDR